MRQLSSPSTFFYKFVYNIGLNVVFALIALSLFIMKISGVDINFPVTEVLIIWPIIAVLSYLYLGRIKEINFDGENFIISNFQSSVTAHKSKVKYISGSRMLNPQLIWLELSVNTTFGKKILFAPEANKFAYIFPYIKHPMIKELKDICGLK